MMKKTLLTGFMTLLPLLGFSQSGRSDRSNRSFPISRCKDTGISLRTMKRMMHKKENLLQIEDLQQIFYQMSEK